MATNQELACIYAALALQDDGVKITAEKIQSLTSAAGVSIGPFWANLYAKTLAEVDVKSLIQNMSSGAAAAPVAATTAAAAPVEKADKVEEKKKEEAKEESDEDMGFGLFD